MTKNFLAIDLNRQRKIHLYFANVFLAFSHTMTDETHTHTCTYYVYIRTDMSKNSYAYYTNVHNGFFAENSFCNKKYGH